MTLTGKQKSHLRSLAMTRRPIFQIGKDGINEALIQSVLDYLAKNELGKVHALETCPDDLGALSDAFGQAGIIVVQKIGRTLVLYKPNPKLEKRIELPR